MLKRGRFLLTAQNPQFNRESSFSNKFNKPTQLSLYQDLSDSVEQAWVSHYASGAWFPGNDTPTDIVTDRLGNIYVTGQIQNQLSGTDYYTVKYNTEGEFVWGAVYSTGTSNTPQAVQVDMEGNVYVTGYSQGIDTYFDYATVKYDISGTLQWVARYDGPENSVDQAHDLAMDSAGNVYVTGQSEGSGYQKRLCNCEI